MGEGLVAPRAGQVECDWTIPAEISIGELKFGKELSVTVER